MRAMLLILDMCVSEISENQPTDIKVIENIEKLIEIFKGEDQLVVFSNIDTHGEIIEPLKKQCRNESYVIPMLWYSPFAQKSFQSLLQVNDIQYIFICGSGVSNSVLKSTMDAFQYDKFEDINVVHDASYEADLGLEKAAISIISRTYGSDVIVTCDQVIYWMENKDFK